MMPVRGAYNASSFGRRIDPFNGQWAMHEGIDFIADDGSPIVAAAGGVVIFAGFHPQYGYMIDIDHGNDLVTRYAHTSKIVVREGDLVQRGRKIGEVGTTGRSTGPHLHFEVRFRGAAQNPTKFLPSTLGARRGASERNRDGFSIVKSAVFAATRRFVASKVPASALYVLTDAIFGSRNERLLKQYCARRARDQRARAGAGEALRRGAARKDRRAEETARRRRGLDELLPEAFAVVREASKRTLRMRHFDVQMHRRHGAAQRQDRRDEAPARARRWSPRCRRT